MKRKLQFIWTIALGVLFVVGCQEKDSFTPQSELSSNANKVIPGQYIVQFKESTFANGRYSAPTYEGMLTVVGDLGKATLRMAQIDFANEDILHVYGVTQGFAIKNLDENEVESLRKNPNVEYVEQDRVVALEDPIGGVDIVESTSVSAQAQVKPWGITRVGGGGNYLGTRQAWIIDTGVDLNHPDLNVVKTKCKSFVSSVSAAASADDDNGHGSHVAGIIGAKNNTIGCIGVAAGAPVIGIKVLAASGYGSYSDIIAGCNWVAAKAAPGDVANLSLGGGAYTPMDNAVKAIAAKGIKVCVAAGNYGDDANYYSPARANATNLYTVSAFGTGDIFAYFSNYGNPPIDYAEPGVNVYSCYKNGGYATLSGTSMAAPHLAGILLLGNVSPNGKVKNDYDKNADVIGIAGGLGVGN
ncbi:MAG: S8 family serine peptidase [Spirosomataceae bacterium]